MVQSASATVHSKIHQVEEENVGTKAAHRTELASEGAAALASHEIRKYRQNAPYKRVEKLEAQVNRANVSAAYRAAVRDNPELQENTVKRLIQKQRIKHQYAKEFRKAKQAEKQGSAFVQKAKDMFGSIGQTVATAVQEHKGGLVMAGAIAMLIIMVFSSLSSCSVMMDGAMSAVLGTSYTSEDLSRPAQKVRFISGTPESSAARRTARRSTSISAAPATGSLQAAPRYRRASRWLPIPTFFPSEQPSILRASGCGMSRTPVRPSRGTSWMWQWIRTRTPSPGPDTEPTGCGLSRTASHENLNALRLVYSLGQENRKPSLQRQTIRLRQGARFQNNRFLLVQHPTYRKRLTVPEIPFSRIDELGAGMYKGECISQAERHAKSHFE